MTVRAQPAMSPGHSARVAEVMALLDSTFRKRYRSSYETPSPSSSLTLPVRKRYRGTSELIVDNDSEWDELSEKDEEDNSDKDHGLNDESQGLEDEGLSLEEEVVPEGQQQAVLIVGTAAREPLGLGYRVLRRRELAVGEDQAPSTFEVGQSSRSVPKQQGAERVSAFRQLTLDTWVDPKDSRVYTGIPAYVPLAALVQTLSSPEWSLSSLPVSPSSPIVPSPIASSVATPTATISIDEDQFIEVGAQLELHGSILYDHTKHLDALPPTLVADIDRDVRELYTRPVLALEAWVGHVDTRLADMSRASLTGVERVLDFEENHVDSSFPYQSVYYYLMRSGKFSRVSQKSSRIASCSDVVAFACVILSLLLELQLVGLGCARDIGVATPRALVYAGLMTSGDARSRLPKPRTLVGRCCNGGGGVDEVVVTMVVGWMWCGCELMMMMMTSFGDGDDDVGVVAATLVAAVMMVMAAVEWWWRLMMAATVVGGGGASGGEWHRGSNRSGEGEHFWS
ncbi:hypothetical protein Tco_0026893 [Tanacetum coccineum]